MKRYSFLVLFLVTNIHASCLKRSLEYLKQGMSYNHTSPAHIQGQSAGHLTGGGLVVRQPNKKFQLIHINYPSISAGACGGWDAFFGGIDFLQLGQLVEQLRKVGQGLPTFALQLYLRTTVPMIEGLVKELRKKLEDINKLLMDECEAKQNILARFTPQGTEMHKLVCQDIKKRGNQESMWGAIRGDSCSPKNASTAIENEKSKNGSKYKELLEGEYNLVWHVTGKMDEYKNDISLRELVMSITGTLIGIEKNKGTEEAKIVYEYHTPQASGISLIGAFVKGGRAKMYQCNTRTDVSKCLKVKVVEHEIKDSGGADGADVAMVAKLSASIQEMLLKYREGDLSAQAKQFLRDAENVPLQRYIHVVAVKGITPIFNEVTEYMAYMILLKRFSRITTEVLLAIDQVAKNTIDPQQVMEFKKRVESLSHQINRQITSAHQNSIYKFNKIISALDGETRMRGM